MDFQKVHPIEKPQMYLDVALRAGRDACAKAKLAIKPKDHQGRVRKAAIGEAARVKAIGQSLSRRLGKVITNFPSLNAFGKFYRELFEIALDVPELKKALASVLWASNKSRQMGDEYGKKIRKVAQPDKIRSMSREFMGRISSVIKRLGKNLELIEASRRMMRTFPDVKEDLKTIVIFGFPNVGKSTLLAKIAGAKPEIASYAFTTKGFNGGKMKLAGEEVQIFDTPGTLARDEKMNNIEILAYLALKYLADVVVYVFDPTETYPLKDQEKLYKKAVKEKKNIIKYVSKTDICKTDIDGIKDISDLKKELEKILKTIKPKVD